MNNITAVDPQVQDNIDYDQVAKIIIVNSGINSNILRSEEDVARIRDERRQQQEIQQQQQQAMLQSELQEQDAKTQEKLSRAEKYERQD